jgi:hypothetical protein
MTWRWFVFTVEAKQETSEYILCPGETAHGFASAPMATIQQMNNETAWSLVATG